MLEAQANTSGFQDGFMLTGVVFIGALIPAYILSRARLRVLRKYLSRRGALL